MCKLRDRNKIQYIARNRYMQGSGIGAGGFGCFLSAPTFTNEKNLENVVLILFINRSFWVSKTCIRLSLIFRQVFWEYRYLFLSAFYHIGTCTFLEPA